MSRPTPTFTPVKPPCDRVAADALRVARSCVSRLRFIPTETTREDLIQEGVLAYLRERDSLMIREWDRVKYTVVNRDILDHLDHTYRTTRGMVTVDPGSLPDHVAETDPGSALIADEMLESLDPRAQRMVRAKVIHGRPVADIAADEGLSSKRVYAIIAESLSQLRDEV